MNSLDRFKVKEIEIDDIRFIIHPLHAKEAYKLKFILIELFGPSIGIIINSVKVNEKSPQDSEVNIEKIGIALSALFQKVDGDKADKLTIRLLKEVEAIGIIDGTQQKILLDSWDNIDKLFRKRLSKIYILMWEVIKENYGDFFLTISKFGGKTKITDILKGTKT